MRLTLDTQLAAPQIVGARAGVAPARSGWSGARLADVVERVRQAADAGVLPHLPLAADARRIQALAARGQASRRKGGKGADRLVIVGEPGAARAVALVGAVRDPGALAVVDQPDASLVDAALAGARAPRLVVLEGPAWVAELAAHLAPRARGVTVFREPGEAGAAPGDDAWEEAGAADPRFGVTGAAGLWVAGFAGVEGTELAAALGPAAEELLRVGPRQNPALRLAVLARELTDLHGLHTPVLLGAQRRLTDWAAWAGRAWAALSARSVPVEGGYQARGAAAVVVPAGDEALVQRLIDGPRDHWTLRIERSPLADDPLDTLARSMLDAHTTQLVRDGRPVVRLHLPGDGPLDLAVAALFWSQAALFAAALDPVDPLTMDAADAWRRLQGEGPPG
ncbi:hypothetical protein L6R53_15450 [Myxococcota bacterium]|nr:hypothetical protein [Myxococcota bacterium]